MGQNGRLTSTFDGTLHGQFGEACSAGDLVGYVQVANKAVFKKATAAVSGQIEAVGVCPRDVLAGDWENVRANTWRLTLSSDLIDDELTDLEGAQVLYLSATTAGAATNVAPDTEGMLLQRVGIAYIDTADRRGVAANQPANAWIVDIQPGTVIPAA
jgi:hypothetical protein